ncbi:MAG: TetR/AcrR family transcriptional regulator [Pseudomonadota bacterium]
MAETIKTPGKRPATESGRKRYHHGNLRQALLDAAEQILNEGEVSSLTLRSAAARAGVSHAAPTHHFGSLKGLLTALAAEGMHQLADAVEAGFKTGEANRAYVAFARDHPGLFGLMFDKARLDIEAPAYMEAGGRAFATLTGLARQRLGPDADDGAVHRMQMVIWARAHGYATLLLSGQLTKFDVGEDQLGGLDTVMWDGGEGPKLD